MAFKIILTTFAAVTLSVYICIGQEKPTAGVSNKAAKNVVVEKSNLRQLQVTQPQLQNTSKSKASKVEQTENDSNQKPVLQNKSAVAKPE